MTELLRAFLKHLPRGKVALAIASTAIALLIYLFGQAACWHDSPIYMFYAQHLFDPLARFQVADRDPAYPFLIWLTGYPQTHSLQGVRIAQTIMAAALAPLVCLTLESVSARLGLAAGWVVLASGIPFALQTEIFTDELHMFLLQLLALALARCIFSPKPSWLYAAFILSGALIFCRPTFWTLVPLVALCAGVWAVKRRRADAEYALHLMVVLVLFSALFSFNVWERELPARKIAALKLPPLKTTFVGTQLMENAYRYGGGLKGTYNMDDGPATREFIRRSVAAFSRCPQRFHDYVHCLGASTVNTLQASGRLAEATASAEATFRTFFYYPRYEGWWFYIGALSKDYWMMQEDEKLLAQVYFEQMTHHPLMLLHMLETGLNELVLTSYYTYNINDAYGYEPFNYDGRRHPQIEFMPVLTIQNCPGEPEMTPYAAYRYISPEFASFARHAFEATYRPLTLMTGVGFLLGACWYGFMLLCRERGELSRETALFFLLFFIYWLPNMLMVMMVMMQFRYQASTAALPLMGAGIFLRRVWMDYASKPAPSVRKA